MQQSRRLERDDGGVDSSLITWHVGAGMPNPNDMYESSKWAHDRAALTQMESEGKERPEALAEMKGRCTKI